MRRLVIAVLAQLALTFAAEAATPASTTPERVRSLFIPPRVDVSVTVEPQTTTVAVNGEVRFRIVVANAGPDAARGVSVAQAPGSLSLESVACDVPFGAAASACAPISGAQAPVSIPILGPGQSVQIEVVAQAPSAAGSFTDQISANLPPGTNQLQPQDNSTSFQVQAQAPTQSTPPVVPPTNAPPANVADGNVPDANATAINVPDANAPDVKQPASDAVNSTGDGSPTPPQPTSWPPWAWLIVAGAVALVVGGLAWLIRTVIRHSRGYWLGRLTVSPKLNRDGKVTTNYLHFAGDPLGLTVRLEPGAARVGGPLSVRRIS